MKNLFIITCFCVLVLLGLAACDKYETEPLRVAAANTLQNDLFYVLPSQTVRLNVLDNDNVPAGGTLTFSTTREGTITADANGFLYTASSQFSMYGTELYYKYCINNQCDSAAVNFIFGNSCNSVLVADYAATPVNQAVDIPVLNNDTLCGQPNAELYTGFGKAVFLPGNILRYTPAPGFSGIDTLSYILDNEYRRTKVWIQVGTTTCTLKANDDVIQYFQHAKNPPVALNISPLRNDWMCKSVALQISSAPAHGTVVKDPENPEFFYYTPNIGFLGTDSFQYKICTSTGDCSIATVNLNVVPQ